jgi:hypothetical protein
VSEYATAIDAWSALANLLLAGAAVAAAIAAFMGLSTWKNQRIWERDHELARRSLIAIYSLRDKVNEVRSPFMFDGERQPDKDAPDAEKDSWAAGTRRAYARRWGKVREAQVEVRSILREADAVWGGQLSKLYEYLHALNHELFVTVSLYLDEISETDLETKKELRELRKEKRDILYDLGVERDEFRAEYDRAIAPIEAYLGEKLGRLTK